MSIYLVRHAHAGSRHNWADDDTSRPLSVKGGHQADAIDAQLQDAKVHRVLSSRAIRCVQTVTPVALTHGVPVEVVPELFEGGPGDVALARIRDLAADGRGAVLCSHGDVLPAVIDLLARTGTPVDVVAPTMPKGTLYVLAVAGGEITAATLVDPRP